MKRFAFRFKAVLDVKELKQELKQKEFAEIERLLRSEEIVRDGYLTERFKSQEFFSTVLNGKISGVEFHFYQEHVRALGRAIDYQEEKIRLLNQSLEEKRVELVEASRQKKVFENLKSRDFKTYCSEMAREEQRFLDDVTTTHHGRFARNEILASNNAHSANEDHLAKKGGEK